MILDQNGNPITTEASTPHDPALRGGWRYASDTGTPTTSFALDRESERHKARLLYLANPLLGGATDIATAFLLGDDLTYTPLDDRTANTALEEFWNENDLGTLITERWLTEFFCDGEQATLFPLEEDDPGRDAPARIAFVDVDLGFRLQANVQRGVTAFITKDAAGHERTWDATRFVWTAHQALWNDPRGWPVLMRAVDAAINYITLLNHRMNTHELQARILGVYKAMVNPSGVGPDGKPDGGAYQWSQKVSAYRTLPKRGGVLTLAMIPDGKGGYLSEDLQFLTPGKGSADAALDARALLRLVGLVIGALPEHWLGEAGNANRATAGEMSTPAVRVSKKRQGVVRSYLNRLARLELKRRFGPDRQYTIKRVEVRDDGLTRVVRRQRVSADRLEVAWNLPKVEQDSLEMVARKVEVLAAQGLASPQTRAALLGVDPALEVELMAAAGQTFGQVSSAGPKRPPVNGKGGKDDPTTQASDPATDRDA